MSANCSHSTGYWKTTYAYNDWTGEEDRDDEYIEEWTYTDIDLHRYKCTQCGEVGYYSDAAKSYYEDGKWDDRLKL